MNKTNFLILAAAVMLIATGCILMRPPIDVKAMPNGHHAPTPGPEAMTAQRIRLAPAVCLAGYVLVVPGILYGMWSRPKG